MAVAAVVFNGTRLNSSDSNTGWGNFVIGGGSPASEPANAYQQDTPGSAVGAVGKRITSTSARQGVDYNGTSVNYSGNNFLWFCKVYVSDGFNVNATWGVEVAMGSADTSNSHRYNVAGSGANNDEYLTYPAQGGYIITAIDPTIDGWAETVDQGGAFDQTAVSWYAVGAQFISGNAKSENVAMDAIDYGTGLTITAGDGASTEGNFTDFVATDQDIKSNRWGVVTGAGDSVRAHGILTIGTASVTEFLDTTSIVTYADGYHSAGKIGTAIGMSNVSSIINIGCTIIGAGKIYTGITDTRPDFTVTGTSGTFDCSANLRNHRNVTFTSICDVENADIECQLLTQASANISNSIIRTDSLTSVACLQDPTFGTTTDLHDVTFIQAGAGHAIELDTATTYNFTNLTFTGYGATTSDSAALDITASSGTVTINISGGTASPTYKTAGATVVIVSTVNVTLSGLQDSTEIRVMQAGSNTVELAGTESATDGTTGDRSFTFGLAAGTSVDIYIVSVLYENVEIYGYTVPALATELPIQQRFDRSYRNP